MTVSYRWQCDNCPEEAETPGHLAKVMPPEWGGLIVTPVVPNGRGKTVRLHFCPTCKAMRGAVAPEPVKALPVRSLARRAR